MAGDLAVTFHRAFDFVPDLGRGVGDAHRVGREARAELGRRATAREGVAQLASLVRQAGDRLVVMAGGGVREENVREIVERIGRARGSRPTDAPNARDGRRVSAGREGQEAPARR